MFSGGIDSTYLAWKYLSTGTENLHLHHVSIRHDTEKMWQFQDESVRRILHYFIEQDFKFEYSESKFEMLGWIQNGYDSDTLMLVAQKLAQNFDDQVQVVMGWNPTDMRRSSIDDRARRNVSANIWSALVESARNRHQIEKKIHFPLIENKLTKIEMIKEIPQSLLDLTWSCRRPKDGNPCERCHACKDIKIAEIKITGEK